ncbi:MAG: prepilin-type N-terminal cleavage/methylation domain-containing protein [Planctomycetota bacterium]|nr:prepilin-type N-terminal cleavage/methylation domain-containing protein [Planctomycetota bacterium]
MTNATHKVTQLPDSRSGFSLLEVLVASGILVVGLASVAALLPAAATRMHQAVVQDRAGALAANAYADIMARRGSGILSATNLAGGSFFPFGSSGIADSLTTQLNLIAGGNGMANPSDATKSPTALFATSGSDSDNRDSIVYTPNGGNLPFNIIAAGPNGALTERDYSPEVCWLATLASSIASPPAGSIATLSIAIFKSPNADCIQLTLTNLNGSGVYTATDSTSSPVSDDDRRAYLGSCSYVLDPNATPPKWCQITSSWTKKTPTGQTISTSIILDPSPAGTSVLAFEYLVRVDTHSTRLD